MSTLALNAGAYETDDAGDFFEFRGRGFRLVKTTPESLTLETPEGTKIKIRAATPILVTPSEFG